MAAPQISAPVPELVWIRPPRQARSQQTLSRILDAAEAILSEKSWEDASVAEIARRAGSSVGAFYTRFPDKDTLLAALHQRFLDEAQATTVVALDEQRWAGASVSAIVRECVAFQVRIQDQRRGQLRAFAIAGMHDRRFEARAATLAQEMEARFAKLIVARRHEILHPTPVVGAGFVARMISAVMLNRLLSDRFEQPGVSLVDELTHAALAYLGVFPEDAIDVL